MQELPMLRPLVLVLKSFLDDKNLLSAYKGGLSSYCLFLMTARYLQEQSTSWGDCGSLLMGFLDFYGNHVSGNRWHIVQLNRNNSGLILSLFSVQCTDYWDKRAQSPVLCKAKLFARHADPAHLATTSCSTTSYALSAKWK